MRSEKFKNTLIRNVGASVGIASIGGAVAVATVDVSGMVAGSLLFVLTFFILPTQAKQVRVVAIVCGWVRGEGRRGGEVALTSLNLFCLTHSPVAATLPSPPLRVVATAGQVSQEMRTKIDELRGKLATSLEHSFRESSQASEKRVEVRSLFCISSHCVVAIG